MAFYPNGGRATLSDSHRRMLFEESGIDPDVAAERGYYTTRRRSEVPQAFKDYQRRVGLVVPMFSPDGETVGYQLRPDRPRKGGPKYETPGGISPIVDVHPRMLEEVRNGDGPLLITEGAKTGDAATSRGIPSLVLAGVWMWCVPKVKPYRLKPCFDHVRLEGREVFVAFDSDCMTKEGVQDALAALVAALEKRGAAVKVIYLPDAADSSKQGVDDYLAGGRTVREMFMLAREFDSADVGRIRLSRDQRLCAGLEDLERKFWATEWKGMGGASARDVYLKLVEAARRHGKPVEDGIRVVKAQGPLACEAKVSGRTLWKALNRLEEWKLIYRDNEGRKPDKSGAFVLRANVSHKGRDTGAEGNVTPRLQTYDPGDLHLRAPRLRWSQPKFTPKRGLVSGTRKVRQSPKLEARDRIERLGKIRGAILDALEAAGGTLTLRQIAKTLHRSRPRDIRRRNLPMLEDARIIQVDGDTVSLTDNWLEDLEVQRQVGKEIEAAELARTRYKVKSHAFHHRHDTPKSRPSAAGLEAVRRSRGLRDAHLRAQPWRDRPSEATLSPLAEAVREYLDRHPYQARQPAGWIGVTLWADGLHPKLDNPPTETRAAIEELGGAPYLDAKLKEAKGVA